MPILISVFTPSSSKYNTYFQENIGDFLSKDPNIFAFPLKLYNYWARKEKLKIKGVRKIVIEISEFNYGGILPPGTELGAIVMSNNFFDFEKLMGIEGMNQKQLFFIKCYHLIMEDLCSKFGWDIENFKSIYEKTIQCIQKDTYPKDFDPAKMFL